VGYSSLAGFSSVVLSPFPEIAELQEVQELLSGLCEDYITHAPSWGSEPIAISQIQLSG